MVTNPPAIAGDIRDWVWDGPLEEEMATHSSILAWEMVGYSPWVCKELNTTEVI